MFLFLHRKYTRAYREIFSEYFQSKPNLDFNYTLFRSIYHQTEFRLMLNLSEKCNFNRNLM